MKIYARRLFKDLELKGTIRTAVEGVNLSLHWLEADILAAECIRTFPTVTFPETLLLKREEAETNKVSGVQKKEPSPQPSIARVVRMPRCRYLNCTVALNQESDGLYLCCSCTSVCSFGFSVISAVFPLLSLPLTTQIAHGMYLSLIHI